MPQSQINYRPPMTDSEDSDDYDGYYFGDMASKSVKMRKLKVNALIFSRTLDNFQDSSNSNTSSYL